MDDFEAFEDPPRGRVAVACERKLVARRRGQDAPDMRRGSEGPDVLVRQGNAANVVACAAVWLRPCSGPGAEVEDDALADGSLRNRGRGGITSLSSGITCAGDGERLRDDPGAEGAPWLFGVKCLEFL